MTPGELKFELADKITILVCQADSWSEAKVEIEKLRDRLTQEGQQIVDEMVATLEKNKPENEE